MNSKIIICILSLIFFFSAFYSCTKREREKAGLNDMEWMVEGEVHKAECGGPITSCSWLSCTTRPCDPITAYFEPEYRTLNIRARNSTYIDLFIEEDLKVNARNIIGESDKMIISDPSLDSCNTYYVDTSMNYKFLITRLDTAKRIMSGEFTFFGVSSDCQDTIHVKDGNFEIDFNLVN